MRATLRRRPLLVRDLLREAIGAEAGEISRRISIDAAVTGRA